MVNEEKDTKKHIKITFKPVRISGWGDLYLLPHLDISIFYGCPTIQLAWWVFRLDVVIYNKLPDWAMKVWDAITFNRKAEEE